MMLLQRFTRGLVLAGAGAPCGAGAGCLCGVRFGTLLLVDCGKTQAVLSAGLVWAAVGASTGVILGVFGSLDEEGFVADVAALWRRETGQRPDASGVTPPEESPPWQSKSRLHWGHP